MKTATKIIKTFFHSHSSLKSRFGKISWFEEKKLKHQEDKSNKKILIGEHTINYQRPWELLHSYREIFEKEIYYFTTFNQSPLIIDCGANIGLSILYYKSLYPSSTIHAFEPDSNNYRLLEKNVSVNQLQDVHLYQQAIWKEKGSIPFSAESSEASHIEPDNGSGIEVTAVRLRDLLQDYGDIDFLKIDIEGAECEVVRDCATSMGRVKNLFLEYHGKTNETEKLIDLLMIVKEAGFRVYFKMAADHIKHPFIEKTLDLPYDIQLNLFCFR